MLYTTLFKPLGKKPTKKKKTKNKTNQGLKGKIKPLEEVKALYVLHIQPSV